MEEDLLKIKKLLLEYIYIIIDEYPNSYGRIVIDDVNSGKELVMFNTDNVISFFVRDGILLLPKAAYSVFSYLKKYDNYGKKIDNYRRFEDYIDTDTTYVEYINHIIEGALSVYDYFEESLLHEAMHICDSKGGMPLEEGINELKTRELAQKKNIRIAAYGYSKEVEIAKRFQKLVGGEIMDELTFVPNNERKSFLSNKISEKMAELYEMLSIKMIEKSKDYYNKLGQISDPFEKAELYKEIDYSDLYLLIDSYM